MNKSFVPISIMPGEISRLSVTIFNPNFFPLTNATWTDNLVGVQPGLSIASPPNVSNSCGGTVQAAAGATSLILSGGTVPAQVGTSPGSCTVSVNVTGTEQGNLINTIPAGALSSTGGGGSISNTTPASATLHIESIQPPSLGKVFSPTTIPTGAVSRLSIRIRNNDLLTTLTQVSISDSLPPGVVLANPVSVALDLCGSSASLSAASGGTVLTLNNSSIAPNTVCTISVNVTSTTTGVYTNTIPAGTLDTEQGLTNSSQASAVLNVQNVNIRKGFSPASFQVGGTTTLAVTLQNPTSTPYTGVAISDTLPGTVLTVVPGSASTTCGGTVSTTLPRTVSLTGGMIPAGTVAAPGTCTISVQVTAPSNADPATFTNTIPANALVTDQGVTNAAPATANVRLLPIQTNVTGSKSFSPATILPGENSRLRINITAPTDSGLTNFSITDRLPPNVTVSNSSPATSSPNCGASAVLTAATGATTVTLTNGTIPAGATCQINVYVTSSVPGVYANTIAPTDITNTENRTTTSPLTANLTVQGISDFSISKTFTPPIVGPGGISTLTITLNNTNAAPLINTSITDNLPGTPTSGLIVAPSPNTSTTCSGGAVSATPGSQIISMTGGTIPAQVQNVVGTCTITVDVQGMGAATRRTNTIPPTNASATLQGTNTVITPVDPASAVLAISNLRVGVVKAFDPLTVFGGSASTLSIELINSNNVTLTGITFTDQMPSGMFVANPPNLSVGTCGGTLSGVPGDDSFSLSGATLPPASSCTLTLGVTMTVNGNLTNIIDPNAVTTFNGATNPDPAQASLTNLPGASLSKFFSPNPVAPGEPALLTITFQNTGGVALSGMGFEDTLPAGIANFDSPAPTNGCGGTLTAAVGSRTITLAGGALGANSACTIQVSVIGGAPGSFTNTIPPGTLTNDQGATNHVEATDTLVIANTVRSPRAPGGASSRGPAATQSGGSGFLIPLTGFPPNISTSLEGRTASVFESTSLTIEIPVLHVNTSIVGVDVQDGAWDVSWLQDQVGWLIGTSYPTLDGNSLLTAHVVNADGKPGVFYHLKSLGVGEYIFIHTGGYRYTYLVMSNTFVEPDDAAVLKHEETSHLTLLTCDTYDEASDTYLRRVAVQARLVDVSIEP